MRIHSVFPAVAPPAGTVVTAAALQGGRDVVATGARYTGRTGVPFGHRAEG